jgi:hypothetical protein
MNTSALKTFAPAVRRQLMEAVTRKLDYVLTAQTPDLLTTFAPQVAALRKLAQADRAGLIDRVAYTWFNRFAALRFMDARGWHPFRARVLTPASAAETQPELLKLTRTGALPEELKSHTDRQRLNDLLDGRIPSPDAQGEVYRHLVLAACRFYHALLPNLFEKLDDETELLLPDDLLTEHSVVHGFRSEISDEDCGDGQRANVEILGWLYQFYISEKKDSVMARKSAVPTEDIPAVTQLFTPHWIVRYLVENSLGRLWLLNRPGSRLREHMPYYIEGEPETDFLKITKPEEIRLCDPAVGSGHMLTYAFDLLVLIYEEEGYAPTEIPALILRHNLDGLEICPRAAQLAELALVFKAREKSRRFFQPEHLVRPHIIELQDVRFDDGELSAYFQALGTHPSAVHPQLVSLLHQFEEAKNFGSLIQPCLTEADIQSARARIQNHQSKIENSGAPLFLRETHLKVLRVLEQAEALTQRYHVVVANPPYLGSGGMNLSLKHLLKNNFQSGQADLFSAFVLRSRSFVPPNAFVAILSPIVWMVTASFDAYRRLLLSEDNIRCLVQLEYNAFEPACVPVCAYVLQVAAENETSGEFIDLRAFTGSENQSPRTIEAINNTSSSYRFQAGRSEFTAIPGWPVAFALSKGFRKVFVSQACLGSLAIISEGIKTRDNERFMRLWFEVSRSNAIWKPYAKGGGARRWYGNGLYVLRWDSELWLFRKASGCNFKHFEKPAISYSTLSSHYFSCRYIEQSYFGGGGAGIICAEQSDTELALAILHTKVVDRIMKVLSPTLNFEVGTVGKIPVVARPTEFSAERVWSAVGLAKADWDNFETSWDFRDQPLLRPGLKGATLEASWRNWEAQSTAAIRRMQELETENNRLFIAAYGLDGELQPEVPEEQITLARADARRDMAAFLSYAVGCMMGRYSPDHPGLILANAGDTLREFLEKVGKPVAELTFAPDEDGIIPVLDGEWFEDDIVARTRDFIRATFGEAKLRENLRFLEDSLGKDLRKYFLNDFYKDHLQTYKKRPIYWLVQSPKKGFSVLIYLHRYTRDTLNLVLNRYLREYQVKLRNRLERLAQVQVSGGTAREKTEVRKEAEKLTKVLHECEEWERQTLLPLAQQRLQLDLDDGVKVNYLKLGEALAPIPGLAGKED